MDIFFIIFIPLAIGCIVGIFLYYKIMVIVSTEYKDTKGGHNLMYDDTFDLFREYNSKIIDKRKLIKHKRIFLWLWLSPVLGVTLTLMLIFLLLIGTGLSYWFT